MSKKYSPEEVLKILRVCNTHPVDCAECPACDDGCDKFDTELLAADTIEELLAQVRWIPVEERLPELVPVTQISGHGYSEAVQICTSGKKIMAAVYSDAGWIFPETFWQAEGENVTHWRPVVGNLPWAKEGA